MGLFDTIFDFDRDGKASFGEELFGFGLLGMFMEATEQEELEASRLLDMDDDFDEYE